MHRFSRKLALFLLAFQVATALPNSITRRSISDAPASSLQPRGPEAMFAPKWEGESAFYDAHEAPFDPSEAESGSIPQRTAQNGAPRIVAGVVILNKLRTHVLLAPDPVSGNGWILPEGAWVNGEELGEAVARSALDRTGVFVSAPRDLDTLRTAGAVTRYTEVIVDMSHPDWRPETTPRLWATYEVAVAHLRASRPDQVRALQNSQIQRGVKNAYCPSSSTCTFL